MKAMKIALLGTAALAAVSVSARADNLSDLKAQIEALNARVASVEAAPAMPAGYQMMSFSKVGNDHVISIMPTADMPATTTITWSGYVWAAVQTYRKYGPAILTTTVTARLGRRKAHEFKRPAGPLPHPFHNAKPAFQQLSSHY